MGLWMIILIGFMLVSLFVLSRPRIIPAAWYQVTPKVFDRLPTILSEGSGWGGRGLHRGQREIKMLPR